MAQNDSSDWKEEYTIHEHADITMEVIPLNNSSFSVFAGAFESTKETATISRLVNLAHVNVKDRHSPIPEIKIALSAKKKSLLGFFYGGRTSGKSRTQDQATSLNRYRDPSSKPALHEAESSSYGIKRVSPSPVPLSHNWLWFVELVCLLFRDFPCWADAVFLHFQTQGDRSGRKGNEKKCLKVFKGFSTSKGNKKGEKPSTNVSLEEGHELGDPKAKFPEYDECPPWERETWDSMLTPSSSLRQLSVVGNRETEAPKAVSLSVTTAAGSCQLQAQTAAPVSVAASSDICEAKSFSGSKAKQFFEKPDTSIPTKGGSERGGIPEYPVVKLPECNGCPPWMRKTWDSAMSPSSSRSQLPAVDNCQTQDGAATTDISKAQAGAVTADISEAQAPAQAPVSVSVMSLIELFEDGKSFSS